MRCIEAGCWASLLAGRRGRLTKSPPQFGHRPAIPAAHAAQNVHSKEQMRASRDSGGKSLSQHSQLGRSSSIVVSWYCRNEPNQLEQSAPTANSVPNWVLYRSSLLTPLSALSLGEVLNRCPPVHRRPL